MRRRSAILRWMATLAVLAGTAAAEPGRETLTIGITQYPATFHPNIESMAAKSYILGFARRPITAFDADWQLVCLFCASVPTLENGLAVRETTPDGKPGLRLTLRLKEGLHWADGSRVSTEDLRFAWEAGRHPESAFAGSEFYRSAYAFEIVDETTAILRFDRVTFDFASFGDFAPLPARIERPRWESDPRSYRNRTAYDTETTNPGLWNGPYRVVAVQPAAGITLERNTHWQGKPPAFRRIQIRTIESTTSLEAQLLAGQLDMIAGELGLPVEQAAALQRRHPGRFQIAYRPGLIYEHIDLRLDNPVLADRRVRQALLLAINRAQVVERLFEGRQEVAHGVVHPLDPMYSPNVQHWPFDPTRAAALLDEAGWRRGADGLRRNAEGEKLSFEFMTTAGNRAREQVQQILLAMWRNAGVEARIRNEPPRVLFGETLSRRKLTGAAMFAWISAPQSVPRGQFHSREIPDAARNWSGQNYTGFQSAEMDRLLEAIPLEMDASVRRASFSRLQAILSEELPQLPLWFRSDAHIWPLWLSGLRPTGHLNQTPLWVEDWQSR